MNPTLKNALMVIGGVAVGMIVNMIIVVVGSKVIPIPEGIDVMDPQSLKDNIQLLEIKHFIFPFLAHFFGTFVGAFFAARTAASHQMKLGIGIGVFFLVMGIINTMQLGITGLPMWIDLVLAYLPAAYLGAKLGLK